MADILDQSLREFAKQGQGFWSRLFKSITNAFGVSGQPVKLFDKIVQQFGSANMRNLRSYVAGKLEPDEKLADAFPRQAVDHFVRALLKGAEELGATSEQLAAINWADIDFDALKTDDPNRLLDLSKIPGLDDDMKDIMSRLSEMIGDGVELLKDVRKTYPEKKSERTQAAREPENPMFKNIEPMFNRMLKWIQFFNPNEPGDKRGQDNFWGSAQQLFSGEKLNKDGPDPTRMSGLAGVAQRVGRAVFPRAVNAGNAIFGMLPGFVQRPIMRAAGGAAAAFAQATGASPAGQAAAAQAGMAAARLAVAFRIVSVASGYLTAGIAAVIGGLKWLSKAAMETTQRVTQYSGALSMATAQSRVATIRRDMMIGQAVQQGGARRIGAEVNLADKMAPLEMAIGIMGNAIGTGFANLNSVLMDVANNAMLVPFVSAMADIATMLEKLEIISAEARDEIVKGADKIAKAAEAKQPRDPMDPLGGRGMPVRELFNAFLNAPPQQQQAANPAAANKPAVPNVAGGLMGFANPALEIGNRVGRAFGRQFANE